MIDTSNFVNVERRRTETKEGTCLKIYTDACRIQLGTNDFKAVESFIGHTCDVVYTPDIRTIVIRMGTGRRISFNHTVSIRQLRDIAVARHGETVSTIRYSSKWDIDEKGRKVLVLTETGRVRYGVD